MLCSVKQKFRTYEQSKNKNKQNVILILFDSNNQWNVYPWVDQPISKKINISWCEKVNKNNRQKPEKQAVCPEVAIYRHRGDFGGQVAISFFQVAIFFKAENSTFGVF